MGRNVLINNGEIPPVLCFSRSEMMQWGHFYVPLHGQGEDGGERATGGETRVWMMLLRATKD